MSLLEVVELLLDSCCCSCWAEEAGLGSWKGSKSGSALWPEEEQEEPSLVLFFLGRKAHHHLGLSAVMAAGVEVGGVGEVSCRRWEMVGY